METMSGTSDASGRPAEQGAGTSRFLNLDFQPLTLSALDVLKPILERSPQPLSAFTLPCLAAWAGIFGYRFHLGGQGRFALVSLTFSDSGETHLFQPLGDVDGVDLDAILAAGRCLPYPLKILGCSRPFLDAHPGFFGHFLAEESRNMANYVYATDDLATLSGKRFAKKRNLISQAEKAYAWKAVELTGSDADACRRLVRQVADQDHAQGRDESWSNEMKALSFALDHFERLSLRGTGILVQGELAAFALWVPNGPDMAVVHFERALRKWKGLYQLVNRETARAIAREGFSLINREEDAGEEGLRHAKSSYFPLRLQPSIALTLKGG